MSITIEEMQKQVHNLAKEKGWWPIGHVALVDDIGVTVPDYINMNEVNVPEKLMLMVSEIAEALEFYRNRPEDLSVEVVYSGEKPDGFWVELADCIIRILDLAGAYNINMEELIKEKHTYNKTRPFRHGNKKC